MEAAGETEASVSAFTPADGGEEATTGTDGTPPGDVPVDSEFVVLFAVEAALEDASTPIALPAALLTVESRETAGGTAGDLLFVSDEFFGAVVEAVSADWLVV